LPRDEPHPPGKHKHQSQRGNLEFKIVQEIETVKAEMGYSEFLAGSPFISYAKKTRVSPEIPRAAIPTGGPPNLQSL